MTESSMRYKRVPEKTTVYMKDLMSSEVSMIVTNVKDWRLVVVVIMCTTLVPNDWMSCQ